MVQNGLVAKMLKDSKLNINFIFFSNASKIFAFKLFKNHKNPFNYLLYKL